MYKLLIAFASSQKDIAKLRNEIEKHQKEGVEPEVADLEKMISPSDKLIEETD